MFKAEFLQKMSKPSKLYRCNFSKQASELSSFISASLKSIVTGELAAQNAGQIYPLNATLTHL